MFTRRRAVWALCLTVVLAWGPVAQAHFGMVIPSDNMIKTDANGVFAYAAPAPGWWGFAALITADDKLERDGVEKEVELGSVTWVRFEAWQEK